MQAYGGLLHTEEALTQPVGMIESGPVSGLVGTKFVGDILGFRNIVAADMGGTTFKVGVIREGLIDYQRTPMVLRYHYALPKMDIVSIGLAGGSIVSLNPYTGAPRIGPRSAGARPGPVCYGFGGTEPTITDIDLILGYLNSAFFLEGRATLDYGNTLQIFKSQIADPLAMEVREAAAEVYRLVNSFMYDLLHKVTVEKGLDPRDYVLFSYGGTAGMHLGAVAQELQVKQVIIPYAASVQGAFGLVSADVTHEYQTTRPMLLPVKVEIVNDMFQQLIDKTRRRLQAEGFADQNMLIRRSIDMRYRYQIHEMTTPLDGQDSMSQSNLAEACHTFAGLYEERYGKESGQSESDIEMVAFRVRGTGLIRRPELGVYQLAGPDPKAGYVETRKIYLCTEEFKGTVEAKGYNFEKLLPGNEIDGPAIIWSPITTILINPGHKARLDSYKNIVLTW
jgi:N-methylhydantoinase A